MGKPFEITYSPSSWQAPPNGVAQLWSVPYGGLNVQFPENQIGPNYTPSMDNFTFRNGELRSRPAYGLFLPGPDGSNPILGVGSFLSKNLVWHTFAFTTNGLFQLQKEAVATFNGGGNPWSRVGGPVLGSNPVSWRTFQSVLYYTNGGNHVSAWDGANPAPTTDVAFTGVTVPPPAAATTIGGLFLGELASHLMLAYTTESTNGAVSTFPQRIRWSCINFNPTTAGGVFGSNLGTGGATFDSSVNVNAGLNDMLDVPDIITGMLFLGRVGYVLRQNGITEISPTGNGVAPFDFNHLWASEQGIGNVYPESIAQYGSYGVIVATNDVYQITPQQTSAIGMGARDAIMMDLSQAIAAPTATIIPSYAAYRVYLAYKLFIPLPNGKTRVYVYSFDDANWARWTIDDIVIGQPVGCWTGDTQISGGPSVSLR